jgi:DNA-binding SARP family transcriptional activator
VVYGVGTTIETSLLSPPPNVPSLEIRMLGPLTVFRKGLALELPPSRKVRALLAYLALSQRVVSRSQLCELLWDVPNDPRGELRWALSKLRGIVDEPGRRRVQTPADGVSLDLSDCTVDAIGIVRAVDFMDTAAPEQLNKLTVFFAGDFLEGLEIESGSFFSGWLASQRRRFRAYHAGLLERLVARSPDHEALAYLEKWLEISPFEHRAHESLLRLLAQRGHIREAEEHLAATLRLFEAERLDDASIRDAWRTAKSSTAIVGSSNDGGDMTTASPRRASVAVMPFDDQSEEPSRRGGTGTALAHDVITRLAKLRVMFVIAQGTVLALRDRQVGCEEAGRLLNVDYVVRGTVQREGTRFTVRVELVETQTARIIWAEVFNQQGVDAFHIMDEITDAIVASVANEIEASERNRAILAPPNSLDAWQAYHRGLWHMYRFDKVDNASAQDFFETAVRLDPTFARAYAGLSFTHFQSAFQSWAERKPETDHAFEAAGRSLMIDDRDPAAHWAMGRALWLRGRHDQSVLELERAVELSPNFALGHYTLAFVHSQTGDPAAAISSSDRSRRLSPFDPLLFGMLGARAMALVRMERFEEAAHWGIQAAARPNAHVHIQAIAALSLALAGRFDEARTFLAAIRSVLPRYSIDDFLTAMHFGVDGEALFRKSANRLGLK